MNILVSLLFILPLTSSTYPHYKIICDSKNTDYDYCTTKDEGFTKDWFSINIPNWKKHLDQFANKTDLHFLEIGTHEGRSALWLLENVLTHPTSRLTCIDPWNDIKNYYGINVFTRFSNNVKNYVDKINIVKDYSSNALRKYDAVPIFDFIYVDGCHTAPCTIEDMVLSFPLLKPGGLMIIDDYEWRAKEAEHKRPQLAVDTFIEIYTEKINVVHKGLQVIIEKIGNSNDSLYYMGQYNVLKTDMNNQRNNTQKVNVNSSKTERKRKGENRRRKDGRR